MIIFNSDIDNTLIYSYKHDIGQDKIGVEVYQDRIISYMTSKSYSMLKRLEEKVVFVPTTTRTVEQYSRINFGIGCPEYALACNGGVLLEHGKENEDWYQDSLKLIKDAASEFKPAMDYLALDGSRCFEVRNIRGLFLFTKSERPLETIHGLKAVLDTAMVDVFNNGIKVYVVPKSLNKGSACLRLKEKLGAERIIAAGDSEFDVPMLKIADIAIAPKKLCDVYSIEAQALCEEERAIFSDYILEYIMDTDL